MSNYRRIILVIAFALCVAFVDVSIRLYNVVSAKSQVCDCWNPHGYWQNKEDRSGGHQYDADGARHTDWQPQWFVRTVWIFGNSGMDDPYNVDALTAASQLQTMVNMADLHWRVVNHSAGGQYAAGELAWLKDTPIRSGDLVLFVDGAMDLGFGVPLSHYLASIEAAKTYSHSKGALFYRFTQPYIDPRVVAAAGPPRIIIPVEDFVNESHTKPYGSYLVALALWKAITPF